MEVPMGDEQVGTDPGALGRAYFLESEGRYGCAEAVFMALKAAHGIDEVTGSSAAMALNGGLADTGDRAVPSPERHWRSV